MNVFTNFRSLALKFAVCTAIAALPLFHAGVAQAEGWYIGGATCHATSGGTVQYNNYAEILNSGTTSMHLVCPVDRIDFTTSSNGGLTSAFVAYVSNYSTTTDVVCAINSKTPGGSSVHWGTDNSVGTGAHLFVSASTSHATFGDYIWVSCDLPAAVSGSKASVESFATYPN